MFSCTLYYTYIPFSVVFSVERERETREMHSCSIRCAIRHLAWLVFVCSWRVAAARDQPAAPKTDPVEAAALNTILGRWGKKASSEWNISGEPCSGLASDNSDWDYYPNINPFIKCDCTFGNNTLCHITKLMLASNPLSGQLPKELGNLTNLLSLYVASSGFSGRFPSTFSKLRNLKILRASDNGFVGKIPDYFGSMTNLKDIAFEGNSFEGPIPQSLSNLTNLINLRLGDMVSGTSSLAFMSNLTSLTTLILRNCKISGDLRA
uniref:non-specific serine/threonine protein kinase n=1 Tax=Oryza punctata TaxID=4537 RepID=A0A0E0L0B9_ORYPU